MLWLFKGDRMSYNALISRQSTIWLLEQISDGVIDPQYALEELLRYLSEAEVKTFVEDTFVDFFEEEDEEQ